jgi:pilus assembly protein TadC
MMPGLAMALSQAEFGLEAREYVSLACLTSLFWFMLVFSLCVAVSLKFAPESALLIGGGLATILAGLSFVWILAYPRLVNIRRVRDLEKNLLYGLRYLTIQVKSGVPLFDALTSLAAQDYGLLSREIGECTKRVSAGWSATQALDELALRNPSPIFRRAVWQLTNAMKAGTDLGDTLEVILKGLTEEYRLAMRRYGSQLTPLAMMYMMLGVITPTMGITFLILVATFTGLPISEILLGLILVVLVIFQFSFLGVVKGRRPSMEA